MLCIIYIKSDVCVYKFTHDPWCLQGFDDTFDWRLDLQRNPVMANNEHTKLRNICNSAFTQWRLLHPRSSFHLFPWKVKIWRSLKIDDDQHWFMSLSHNYLRQSLSPGRSINFHAAVGLSQQLLSTITSTIQLSLRKETDKDISCAVWNHKGLVWPYHHDNDIALF